MPTQDPNIIEIFQSHKTKVAERRISFDYAARIDALDKLEAKILEEEDAICAALHTDFAKHPDEVMLTEILPVLVELTHTRKHLRRWMRPKRASAGLALFGTSAKVRPTPKGAALIIAPWNFPFNLAIGPVVSALAAGCSVIIKPSELTPATSSLIARMMADIFPANLVTVVQGGVDVSTQLLEQPFDHIFFTGSPAVGKIVMQAASKTLASVTLELGGKSPVVVSPDADITKAARWIAWGRFMNGGQTCVAPDHVFAHDDIKATLRDAIVGEIENMYGTDPLASADFPKMTHEKQFHRVADLITDAREKGATIVTGGVADSDKRKIAPTVLCDLRDDMSIQSEEIFGPILPIMGYKSLDTVIDRINAAPHPLALYVFGDDDTADAVIAQTTSGTVGVNLSVVMFTHPSAPFGGVGNSGNGVAHGYDGFMAFSHARQVLRARFFPLQVIFPPYGKRTRRLLSAFKRIVRI